MIFRFLLILLISALGICGLQSNALARVEAGEREMEEVEMSASSDRDDRASVPQPTLALGILGSLGAVGTLTKKGKK